MIPILYDKNEIAFVSNGLGRLVDCVSCEVTEERNGVYECEFVYPMTGRFYQEMVENGGIISVIHDDAKDRQAFDIYKYSAPIDGLVTFNARHISYRLSGIVVRPFTAASCALALQGIKDNSVMPNPFTFWTDKVVLSTFTLDVPASARALLAGQQGSILDVYGKGEYKYNNFDVRLYVNRGIDSGVEIRYGKNLSNMTRENDKGDLYNSIAPYWKGESGVVTVPGYIVTATGQTVQKCVPMDFSGEFSEEPTAAQLQAAAENYLAENEPWAAFDNITVDFVQLWETEDYKDVAVLERCSLCDTVSVYFPALGVTNTHAKIIKVTYDVLRERYSSMELGSPQTTLSQAVLAPYQEAIDSIDEKASVSFLESAIQAATDLITGGLGGHVVIGRNADGKPNEILIMDTDDKATAMNVWRWNLNGLAHSHSGYNGPFNDIAITQDGKINASMILTGYLVANYIKGGTLTLGGSGNGNGIMRVLDANGNVVCTFDNNGGVINGNFVSKGQNTNLREILTSIDNGRFGSSVFLNGQENYMGGLTVVSFPDDVDSYGVIFEAGGSYNGNSAGARYSYDSITLSRNNTQIFRVGADGSVYSANDIEAADDVIAGGDLSVAGAASMGGDATVGGVLGVTNRRASARLSSAGWYRVCWLEGGSQYSPIGALGALIRFNIVVYGNDGNNGNHQIDYISTYGTGNRKFVNEQSNGVDTKVDKIRCMRDGNDFYIDIHFTASSNTDVYVFWDFFTSLSFLGKLTTKNLAAVADAPSGETSLAEYSFSSSGVFFGDLFTNGALLIPFLTAGTAIPSGADLHTYKTPGVYYATSAVAGSLSNSNITTVPFKLIVMPGNASGVWQIELAAYSNCIIAIQYFNGSTWGGWKRLTPA